MRVALVWLCCCLLCEPAGAVTVRIGSKAFTESHVLAELAAQTLEQEGHTVERRLGLGGTLIVFEALKAGEIDLYPEYTGTLSQTILQQPGLSRSQLAEALAEKGMMLAADLGFNNSYAITVGGEFARQAGITRISQLAALPDLRVGFSLEFLNRQDGWPALSSHYGLEQQTSGLEHALAYRAIASGQLDVTDAYTTDGDLDSFDLVLLEDDRQFFPGYYATLLARQDIPAGVREVLARLDNSLTETRVRQLNARVAAGQSPRQVVADYLGIAQPADSGSTTSYVLQHLLVHLKLTGIALLLACLFAVPLALALSRYPQFSGSVIYLAGLLQTIPSLALLALLIPLVGLGELPAIIALFLYSLLPIIRNTLTGIFAVDPLLRQVALAMGLTHWQRLRRIDIPLAMPMILAGIKTAAIISIGTATLAAFVGAGGLGEPIITGLTLNNHRLILMGAVPAAALAIVTEFLFEYLERALVPRHLLQTA